MMLRALIAATLIALAIPAGAQDPVINFATDDPAMATAIDEARASLPLFLDHALDGKGVSVEGALVKVALPTVPGSKASAEHIWVAPFARLPDGSMAGLLANAPVELGALQEGDRVDFTRDMISDWHLTSPSGTYWGSYTSRVMYQQGAFGDTPFEQLFEADPVPADWK